jgi:hypothetical protein
MPRRIHKNTVAKNIAKLNHITGMTKSHITQAFVKGDMNKATGDNRVRHYYQYRK